MQEMMGYVEPPRQTGSSEINQRAALSETVSPVQ